MPSAILDLDVEHLPPAVSVPERYRHALILMRWRGKPLGQVTLRVAHGCIAGGVLRDAVLDTVSDQIVAQLAARYLGIPERAAPCARAVTVAVCTRDRADDLDRCLTALRQLPDDGQEILVVDSASRSDATARMCAVHGVRCVREERPGLDRARNRALREARAPIVAFTDDDAAPDRGWLRALCRHFDDPRVLGVTGLTMPLELETEAQEWFERTNALGRGFLRRRFDGSEHNALLVARIGAGANQALRKDVLALVGPFDEALDAGTPTRSGGDHDMYSRILAAGYTIVYDPEALSWHRHRREWRELRDTVFGYGVGVYAYLTAQLLRREANAPRVALGWLRVQIPALLRSLLRRPGHIPLDLLLAELAGCALGPLAYLRSRRRLAAGVRHS
jgi:cellulose synthase/poly-beta-1,6-N-acetylglucosamine synthase-like glycosyltransferase